jgi:hypothetical protein
MCLIVPTILSGLGCSLYKILLLLLLHYISFWDETRECAALEREAKERCSQMGREKERERENFFLEEVGCLKVKNTLTDLHFSLADRCYYFIFFGMTICLDFRLALALRNCAPSMTSRMHILCWTWWITKTESKW